MTGFKSKRAMVIGTNLCKEIFLPASVYEPFVPLMTIKMPPKPKYQFTRTKWYEADLFNKGYNILEVRAWCIAQFGPHPRDPDAWSRWSNNSNSYFRFRDEKDYMWFVLKWSI